MGWLLILLCSIAFVLNYTRWISIHFSPEKKQSKVPKNREWFLNSVIVLTWSGLIYVPVFLFFKYGLLAAIIGLALYITINATLSFVMGMKIVNLEQHRKQVLEQFNDLVYQVDHQLFPEDISAGQQAESVLAMFLLHQKLVQAGVLPEFDIGSLDGEIMPQMMCLAHFATKTQAATDRQKFLSELSEEDIKLILKSGQDWAQAKRSKLI